MYCCEMVLMDLLANDGSPLKYLQTWNKVSLKRGWLLRSTSYDTWAVTLVETCVCLDCFAWIAWVIAAANIPRKPIGIRELWRGERTGVDLFLSWPGAAWYCSVDVACCLLASDYSFWFAIIKKHGCIVESHGRTMDQSINGPPSIDLFKIFAA